jgi:hypothetical protein
MPLGPTAPLDLPAPPEPVRSLVRAATPIDWPGGRVGPVQADAVCPADRAVLVDPCDPATVEAQPRDYADETPVWEPSVAVVADTCTSLVWQRVGPERARQYLTAERSLLWARELWTGEVATTAGWTNGYLADEATVTVLDETAQDPVVGFAYLEEAVASCPGGSAIHASVRAASVLMAKGVIEVAGAGLVSKLLRTPVIVDAGYPGTGPGVAGGSASLAEQWVYGTGTVYRLLDDTVTVTPDESQRLTVATNDIAWQASQLGLFLWDGCCHYAVPLDLTPTTS